jgi:hypothetical protein
MCWSAVPCGSPNLAAFFFISKPGYYYDTIMTFGIFYLPYDTIMTLLLHLWLLQKFYYYDTLWQNPWKHYYYTYDMTIMTIMTIWIYYDTYSYYDTIISLIAFYTIMTLMTFR